MLTSMAIRILSIVLLFAIFLALPSIQFKTIFISMLFAHYTMSLYYAKNHLVALVENIKKNYFAFIIMGGSLVYFLLDLHIVAQVIFTILHITISDIYMLNDIVKLKENNLEKKFLWHSNLSRFLLLSSCMLLIFTNYPIVKNIPKELVQVSVFMATVYFLLIMFKFKKSMSKNSFLTYILFEASTLVVTFGLIFFNIQTVIQQLVFYHVLVWLCYPLLMNYQYKKTNEIIKFLIILLVTTIFYLILGTPFLGDKVILDLNANLPFWASMHFISTILLSRYNPEIVLSLLNKRPREVVNN